MDRFFRQSSDTLSLTYGTHYLISGPIKAFLIGHVRLSFPITEYNNLICYHLVSCRTNSFVILPGSALLNSLRGQRPCKDSCKGRINTPVLGLPPVQP